MDSTHNSNSLKWKLFTLMARSEHGRWIPCAYMLSMTEDGNIIGAFLRKVKAWCGGRGAWRLRYIVTDDSAAEQKAVRIAFRGLEDGEQDLTFSQIPWQQNLDIGPPMQRFDSLTFFSERGDLYAFENHTA